MKRKHKILTTLTFFILLFVALGIWAGSIVRDMAFTPLSPEREVYMYIYPEDDEKTVIARVDSLVSLPSLFWFEKIAGWKKYGENVKTGRYRLDNVSSLQLLRNLISGNQVPIRITFNNIRTKEDLAARLAPQLMADSLEIIHVVNDTTLYNDLGLNRETVGVIFIPNTYEVYWNMPPEKLMRKMRSEYEAFWTTKRRALADSVGLSLPEVSILASIVEEESKDRLEQPVVAGLYLNRMRRGMLLQADPTVKYAMGDPALRRILRIHLDFDSPYNTYLYTGLPPGPIRIPSIQAIDAVLNYAKHDYLYMCAKEDFSGRHNFAKTLTEHNRNAARYQRELNKRRIF